MSIDQEQNKDHERRLELLNAVKEASNQSNLTVAVMDQVKEFGKLALQSCLTINSGGLIAIPAIFKIFAPEEINQSQKKIFASVCYMLAWGTAASCLASILAWGAAFFNAFDSGKIFALPILEAQMNLFPESMTKPQIDSVRKYKILRNNFQRRVITRASIVAIICVTGFVLFICAGLKASKMMSISSSPQNIRIATPPVPLSNRR